MEVDDIRRGVIALQRNFTGTLIAREEFVVSPKIDGRIVHLEVNFGDSISRNQVVARLDDEEHFQAVTQAEADVAVSQANLAEAQSLLIIAKRELKWIEKLSKSGFDSVSRQDEAKAKANQLIKQALVQVTRAPLIYFLSSFALSYL